MNECPQDVINQIWRLFAAQGIGDDLQIIETLAYYLLQHAGYEGELGRSSYPQPIPLSDPHVASLQTLLAEARHNHTPADLLNHCLLFRLDTMQAGGRYPTPRHITRLMADLARIFVTDEQATVADFACGSGGLLAEFAGNNVTGIEIAPNWARIARANLLLHGMTAADAAVHTKNALAIVGSAVTNPFDSILMNPPFGAPLEASLVEQQLDEGKGTRSETVLTLLALNYLKGDGVLAVLQPGGALFSTSSGEATLRTRLLRENRLEAIIQLPKDAFQPFSQLQTYLLLARGPGESSLATGAPVWFYHIAHDGFSSGRNRQPQPEQSQLPLLVAAVAAGQAEESAWEIHSQEGALQLDVRPLASGGYRLTQPDKGKITIHTLTTPGATALRLTRQTDEETHQALLHEAAMWQQRPLPSVRNHIALERLTFHLADDDGQAVTLEPVKDKEDWRLTLKTPHVASLSETLMPESGFLGLFVAEDGTLLSPLLHLADVQNKPKPLTILPLVGDGDEAAGSLLLWDSSAALFFASEQGEKGWLLLADTAGTEEAALIGWEDDILQSGVVMQRQSTFTGESWHRGVVVDAQGIRFGVGVDPAFIRDERQFDLKFDRYYLPDGEETAVQRSAAEILATMREKQQVLSDHLNYLLGLVEMRPTPALPPSIIDEIEPLGPLNHSQRLVWQRISNMTEEINDEETARPFRPEELVAGLNEAEVQQALELFEHMGVLVSIIIDGAPYYRRLTERDVVAP